MTTFHDLTKIRTTPLDWTPIEDPLDPAYRTEPTRLECRGQPLTDALAAEAAGRVVLVVGPAGEAGWIDRIADGQFRLLCDPNWASMLSMCEVKRYETADGEKALVVRWRDEYMEYATYSKGSPGPLYRGPSITEAQHSLGMSDVQWYNLCLSAPVDIVVRSEQSAGHPARRDRVIERIRHLMEVYHISVSELS